MKSMGTAVLFFAVLLGCGVATGEDLPGTTSRSSLLLERLQPITSGKLVVHWPATRKMPARVAGFQWESKQADARASAREFLAAFPELVGVDEEFVCDSIESSHDRKVVHCRQMWRDLEVLDGRLSIVVRNERTVLSVSRSCDTVSTLERSDEISADTAREIAFNAIFEGALEYRDSTPPNLRTRLAVSVKGGTRVVYRVVVPVVPLFQKWVCIIDAKSGRVLQKTNEVIR